jgi:hypothetical protein
MMVMMARGFRDLVVGRTWASLIWRCLIHYPLIAVDGGKRAVMFNRFPNPISGEVVYWFLKFEADHRH